MSDRCRTEALCSMPLILVSAFMMTAILYASVGFGGGSTYSALLVMNGTDYRVLPSIALACNIIVVAGGVVRFAGAGHLSVRRMAPFIAASIPMAWAGGRIPISETLFTGLLGGALLLSGLHLAFEKSAPEAHELPVRRDVQRPLTSGVLGGLIGLVSGLVGIGGGIFLAPALYFMRWGTPRQIAAASSLFILVNSISGLAGQMAKLQDLALLSLTAPYWPLPVAVLVGGQIGSWFAVKKFSPELVRFATAGLVIYVGVRLILNLIFFE